jgi:predicted DNA-binding protein (UPF0251 family)
MRASGSYSTPAPERNKGQWRLRGFSCAGGFLLKRNGRPIHYSGEHRASCIERWTRPGSVRREELCTCTRCRAQNAKLKTMTEPLQTKGLLRQLSGRQARIPSGLMQAVLLHALQLPRSCREAFLLCDVQQHTASEAAGILGISPTGVDRRLQLARRQMNDVIERLCGTTMDAADGGVSGAEGGI